MNPEEEIAQTHDASENKAEEQKGTDTNKKKTNPEPELQKIIDEYIASLNSLSVAQLLMQMFVSLGTAHARKTFQKTVSAVKAITGPDITAEGLKDLGGGPLLGDVMKVLAEVRPLTDAFSTLPPGFIITMVSQYDYLVSRIYAHILNRNPGILEKSERKFTFSELQNFTSIDEAREALIEREVETLLRQSHYEQIERLESILGMELRVGLDVWPEFIELTQRRNIFTHAKGIVSRQYLAVCRAHGVKFEQVPKIGDKLTANAEYIRRAHEILFEMGVKLGSTVWRKLDKVSDTADKFINTTSYDLIVRKQYDLACVILDFAYNQKKISSDRWKKTFAINLANAHRLASRMDSANQLLDSIDWSSAADVFKIGVACIKSEYSSAAALMRRVSEDDIDKLDYRHWPLFIGFRESDEFKAAYLEIFKEPFEPDSEPKPGTHAAKVGSAIQLIMDAPDEEFDTEAPSKTGGQT